MRSDTDFTSPPRRGIGALALLRDREGTVLLVEKRYRSGHSPFGGRPAPPPGPARGE